MGRWHLQVSAIRHFGYMLVADPDYVLALYSYPCHNSNDRPTKPTDFEVSNTLPAPSSSQ